MITYIEAIREGDVEGDREEDVGGGGGLKSHVRESYYISGRPRLLYTLKYL